jgi:hypothetical protein
LLSMWLSIICNPSLFTQEKGMENIACEPVKLYLILWLGKC